MHRKDLFQSDAPDISTTYVLANQLLGGRTLLRCAIRNKPEAHCRICQGLPVRSLMRVIRDSEGVPLCSLLAIVGMSKRSFQRRKQAVEREPGKKLNIHEGSQLWKFAEVLAQATQTLGSREAAERWLATPQIALDRQRPIELLTTWPGTKMVEELLLRMEFGVYT